MLFDPDGEDWYEVENTKTNEKEVVWTEHKSQADMDKYGVKGSYLGLPQKSIDNPYSVDKQTFEC